MLQVQENATEAVKVESERERVERMGRECSAFWQRDYKEERERERESRRAQTVGELVNALARNDYNANDDNRHKMKLTLCGILRQAERFYAGNNDGVCRGALAIAAAAVEAEEADGYVFPCHAKQMAKYLILLANEMLKARGAGYFDFDTRTRLDKVTDLLPDPDYEDWEWPSPEVETTRWGTIF